ncbi:gamma-glutamyltransferase 2 [Litoreibacter halocynthiae]|uniref:Gamma-glutamyltransferase 2 n=1 Tax=Litoreibacter halocynthiae TaxID=1242689 RepID=A0A4R7LFE1_9RHOB|nr:gamma-glutamyltransferase family protein [Litoreibacter halocynthiae]TDT73031.1 gamma-glutamyltransferase 2 [Litoreibacter halocynthiae]
MRDFHQPGRSTVFATNGMCATSHPLAAKVAVQMLEAGGNAVDAAIAGAVLLGFCEPQMTGIGGDCFVLLSKPGEPDIIALNGSGRAPKGLSASEIRKKKLKNVPVDTVDAITLPGAIDAFCRLSKNHGKLGLKAILAPSIYYAEAGVPVAPRTSFDWTQAEDTPKGAAAKYYLLEGKAPKPGQLFRSPQQAEVLRLVAERGRAGFYEGEVAEDMVTSLQAAGGTHTLDDFAETSCDYTAPVSGVYKGTDLVEHPPNGQGATAILMNNILGHFDLASMDPLGSARAHIEIEASKLAYDARNRFLADPDFTTRINHMLAPETATDLAALIDPQKAMSSPSVLSEQVHKDTVYITVVDKDLMSVSLIYSIFHSFGSGIASDKFGVLFQNRGCGFSLEEGHPNEAAGGKRPMHTIIPGLLRQNGETVMPFGVMGGAYQPCGHARFVTNLVDFDMHPQAAIDAPRCFSDEGELRVERGYSDAARQELSDLGHNVTIPNGPIGGAQAIFIDRVNGVLHGASDPRKDGCALGY